MPAEMITFQKFNDIGLANAIAAVLQENGIEYIIEDNSGIFDISFANNRIDPEIKLKIHPDDFRKANTVLGNYYAKQLDDVDGDYYLLSFSNDELKDIVSKPDEWGQFDYQLAKKLLGERGIEISSDQVASVSEQRLEELAKPEAAGDLWIYFAYLTASVGSFIGILLLSHIGSLGGCFLGIVLGWIFARLKKTLPDGSRVYVYRKEDRNHGVRIMIIGVIGFIFWTYFRGDIFRYLFRWG